MAVASSRWKRGGVLEMLKLLLLLSSLDLVLPDERPVSPQVAMVGIKPPGGMQVTAHSPSTSNPSDFFLPFNVTIRHLSPRSIGISWTCKDTAFTDRYEVTIKPVLASYKVVETVPNNICYLLMDKLEPDTTYQIAVASIAGRSRRRSGYVIFRTYMEEDDYTEFTDDSTGDFPPVFDGSTSYSDFTSSSSASSALDDPATAKGRLRVPRVRVVEISLVGLALVLWMGAILLFFHRWGKIRMLLPYQPDYKEMKNTTATCTPHHQCQKLLLQNPASAAECCPAGAAPVLAGPYHHPLPLTPHHHPTHYHYHHHHLPHQPMSEPGPGYSNSFMVGGQSNVNVVTLAETGCSPIPYQGEAEGGALLFNEDDISIDMGVHHLHHHSHFQPSRKGMLPRKARSAEQLKQCICPWDEHLPGNINGNVQCTEF